MDKSSIQVPFLEGIEHDDVISTGVTEYGFVETDGIAFDGIFRSICESNGCGNYCRTWACPPAIGSLDECRERVLSYPHAMVFKAVYTLEDSFDFEGMMEGHREFKDVVDRLYAILRKPCLMLSNEGCTRCDKCTYPTAPCRVPEGLFHSLEGYGINVRQLSELAGLSYISGENTVSYFGMVCFG